MGCAGSVPRCPCDAGAGEDRTAEALTLAFPLISTLFCNTTVFEVMNLNMWCVLNTLHSKL